MVVAAVSGFLGGILGASVFDLGVYAALFVSVLALSLWLFVFLCERWSETVTRAFRAITLTVVLVCLGVSVGVARMHLERANDAAGELDAFVGEQVTLTGVVNDEVSRRSVRAWGAVAVETVAGELYRGGDLRVRIAVPVTADVAYGDRVELTGTLTTPENFITETGREFDYVHYLAKDDVYYQMWRPEVSVRERGVGNPITAGILEVKHTFLAQMKKVVPEPHAALAGGMLLGTKEALGDTLDQRFRDTGIIHIVVLSGYNVTIAGIFILWFFSFLPRRWNFLLAAFGIAGFAVMVGAGATVLRASIMALIALAARYANERYNIHRALAIAAGAMVAVNPDILMYDPSFQLSFLATIGLVYLSPLVERAFTFLPRRVGVRETVVATAATQLFVLPYLVYLVGDVSLVTFPVNVLVLPAVPLAMLAGFVTGLAGFVSSTLAVFPVAISYVVLEYILTVVKIFAAVPYAAVTVPSIPVWFIVLIYGVLVGVIAMWHRAVSDDTYRESVTGTIVAR